MNSGDLEAHAGSWRAERRRAILLETLCWSVSGAAVLFGAAALLDRCVALPREARLALLAAWTAGQAWILAARLVGPWRDLTWPRIFAAAARSWPKSGPLLASAWALRAGPAAAGTSEELRAEHLARADRLAAELPARGLFPWKPSRGAFRLAVAAAVALAANAAWGDRASWARVLSPWRDAALDRWVDVSPGDARLDWGAPAVVRARPTAQGADAGVRAAALILETRGADGVWRALAWTDARDGEDDWKTDALSAPLDYRVRWRDMVGRALRLDPVAPPRWSRAAAIVRDSRGERTFVLGQDAAVRARRGDWVELVGEPEAPLSSADARLSGATRIAMRLDGKSWKGGFTAESDATLSFDLSAADGRRDPSPPAYALTVAADLPPTAELLSPQQPLIASPDDKIPVTWAARDDGAVTRAALVVRVSGRERSIPLDVPSPPRAEALGDYSWALSGLAPGARAEFWIEAWDDALPPQTGVSEKGSVEIVDAAADHAAALAARDAAEAAVAAAAVSAEAARDSSQKGDLDASARQTRSLRAQWAAARKALEDWAKRSASDPRGDPGLGEEAQRASEEFAQAGEEGLPAAEKALAAPDAGAAAREQDALAEQARGVQQSMREAAKAQQVQDFAEKMRASGDSGDKMADAAGRLAARGKDGTVSPAELEKLSAALDEVEKNLDQLRKAMQSLPEISSSQAEGRASDLPLDAARQAAGDLRRALESGDVAGASKAARRLAESLKTMAKTLDEAGRRAAAAHGRRASEAASGVQRAWREAEEAQTRAAEAARKVETARQAETLSAQRELVSRVADDFDRLLSSRAASGSRPALGVDDALQEAGRRLRAGEAASAALLMGSAAAHAGAGGLSQALGEMSSRLQRASRAPAPDAALARAAAGSQSAALDSARALSGRVKTAARSLGYLSGRVARRVDDAIAEEDAGLSALGRGDSTEGLKRAEAALAILQEGGREAESAASMAEGAAGSMGGGAPGGAAGTGAQGGMASRAAPRGTAGASMARVRLPSADDYRPPRALREELERSLQEPRPPADDSAIKEYFERLAR